MQVRLCIHNHRGMSTVARPAFTLIEVLIAMLLGAFLMLAVFETFFVSARYRLTANETHIRGIELSNTIRDFSNDLLAESTKTIETNAKPKDPADPLLQTKLVSPTLNFRDSFALDSHLQWKQFSGKSDYLALRTRAWSTRFSRMPKNVQASGETLVIWWVYRGPSPSIIGWRNQDVDVSKKLSLPPNAKGLIRTQIFIDQTGAEQEHSEVILPEAVELRLRYFNGREMQNDWDPDDPKTTNKASVPTAIELRLKLANEEIEHWIHIPSN